jgi:hypothetical protein
MAKRNDNEKNVIKGIKEVSQQLTKKNLSPSEFKLIFQDLVKLLNQNPPKDLVEWITKQVNKTFESVKDRVKAPRTENTQEFSQLVRNIDSELAELEDIADLSDQVPSITPGSLRGSLTSYQQSLSREATKTAGAIQEKLGGVKNLEQRMKGIESFDFSGSRIISPSIQKRASRILEKTANSKQEVKKTSKWGGINQFQRELQDKPYAEQEIAYQQKLNEIDADLVKVSGTSQERFVQFEKEKISQSLSQAKRQARKEEIQTAFQSASGTGDYLEQYRQLGETYEKTKTDDPRFAGELKDIQRGQANSFKRYASNLIKEAASPYEMKNGEMVPVSLERQKEKTLTAQREITDLAKDNDNKYVKALFEVVNGDIKKSIFSMDIRGKREEEINAKVAQQAIIRDKKILDDVKANTPLTSLLYKQKPDESAEDYASRIGSTSAKWTMAGQGALTLANAGLQVYNAYRGQLVSAPSDTFSMQTQRMGINQGNLLNAMSYSPEAMVRYSGLYGGFTGQTGAKLADKLATQQTERQKAYDRTTGYTSVVQGIVGGVMVAGGIAASATGAGATLGIPLIAGGLATAAGGASDLMKNPYYQSLMGGQLGAKADAGYQLGLTKTQQDLIEADMRRKQIFTAREGSYQKGLETYSGLVDAVGARALNPIDLATGRTRDLTAETNIVKGMFTNDEKGKQAFINLQKGSASRDPLVEQQRVANQSVQDQYLSEYGVGINEFAKKAAMVTGTYGRNASRGLVKADTERLYGLGLAGLGSFEQQAGNLSAMNALTGQTSSIQDLEKVMTNAVKSGFDGSRTGQQFIQSSIQLTSQLGVGDVARVSGSLGAAAALMGGRERDLTAAAQGIVGQQHFMQNRAMGGLADVAFMTSGSATGPMRNTLYNLNQSPAKARLVQDEIAAFQASGQNASDYISSNPKLATETISLLRSSGGDKAQLGKFKTTLGISGNIIGGMMKSFAPGDMDRIKKLKDKVANGGQLSKEDVKELQSASELTADVMQGFAGIERSETMAKISSDFDPRFQKQLTALTGSGDLKTQEERGKEEKRKAAVYQNMRVKSEISLMSLGAASNKENLVQSTQFKTMLGELGKQNFDFMGSGGQNLSLSGERAKELLEGKKTATNEAERELIKAGQQNAGTFGRNQVLSGIGLDTDAQKVEVTNFGQMVAMLSTTTTVPNFSTAPTK